MKSETSKRIENNKFTYPLIAAFLTLFSLLITMISFGMWPFGEKTILTIDMYAQYAPLLAQFRSMILDGSLSTYSFDIGAGTNFLPLFAYYLASPFNILLLIFPEHLIAEAALSIIIIKITLSAMCFCFMLQYTYKKHDLKQVAVSIMYALSMYTVAYSWCIMWLDSILALPLLVFAFERMMRSKKRLFFILMVSFSVITNYYIGFMLGVFIFLYFIVFILREKRTTVEIKKCCMVFFTSAVIGVLISAFLVLPVYDSLKQTSAAASLNVPKELSNFEMWKLLGRTMFGVEPTIRSKNLPNIYCGVFAIILFSLFNTIKQIPVRRRVTYSSLMLLMWLSLILSPLDLFWHGFHSPNDLPYRESFIFCFVILLISYETLNNIKNIRTKNLFTIMFGALSYILIEENFNSESLNDIFIYLNILFLIIYCCILFFTCKENISMFKARYAILALVFIELTSATTVGFFQMDKSQSFALHDDYIDNDKSRDTKDAIYKIELNDKEPFYRVETLPRLTCVDTALFDYRGITTFASSNSYNTTKLMKNLGYQSNGVNSYMYKSFIAPVDAILAIKYLVTSANITGNNYLTKSDFQTSNTNIYENNTALPLGFLTSDSIVDYKSTLYNPFKSQMDLYFSMGIQASDFYKYNDIMLKSEQESTHAQVTGKTSFKIDADSTSSNFKSQIKTSGQAFAYIDCTAANLIKLESGLNKWELSATEPFIVDLGFLDEAREVFVNIESNSACSGNIFVVTLDENMFRQAVNDLKKNQLEIKTFKDSNIKASMNASTSGVVFTSIPYDEGWNIKLDGSKIDKLSIDNGFLAFNIPEGEHNIEIKFVPRALLSGSIISILSVSLVLTMYFLKARNRNEGKNDYNNNSRI